MHARRVSPCRLAAFLLSTLAAAAPAALAQTAIVDGHRVTLVSVTPQGTAGNEDSVIASPHTTGTGPCVAFGSAASDLVAGDTNGQTDVFVREAGTTVRVSVASDGAEGNFHADAWRNIAVGAGCRIVAFASMASNFAPVGRETLQDVFVRDRDAGTTTRVPLPPGDPGALRSATSPSLSEDGRFVAFDTALDLLTSGSAVYLHDRVTQATVRLPVPNGANAWSPAVSGNGRFVAFTTYIRGAVPGDLTDDRLWLYDRLSGTTTELARIGDPSDAMALAVRTAISWDGRRVAFWTFHGVLPADTNLQPDVYLIDTDTRAISLVSAGPDGRAVGGVWPALSRDGRFVAFGTWYNALIPDGYGAIVLDTWTGRLDLAASSTGAGWILPLGFTPDALHLAVSTAAGLVSTDTRAESQDVYLVSLDSDGDGVPDRWETTFGTNPAVADAGLDPDGDGRTNLQEFLDGTHPRGFFRRLLSEGATGYYTTSVALANPNEVPATALVSFHTSLSETVRRKVALEPNRATVLDVGTLPGMQSREFSTTVESDQPLAVERLMTWASSLGGHAETAIAAPSTTWHFAEGATHSGFQLFYLLENASAADASVEVTYLLPDPQPPVTLPYVVPAFTRKTIWVNVEDARLSNTDLSASIVSTVPLVAERAMYIVGPAWSVGAGHAAAGVKAPATSWLMAEGATGAMFDLFVLLANPGDTAADVELRYLLPGGSTVVRRHLVEPRSRRTVWVDYDAPELLATAVSTYAVSLNDVPIVAERAMWWPGPAPSDWKEAHAAPASRATARRWVLPPSAVTAPERQSFLLLANPGPFGSTARLTMHAPGVVAIHRDVNLPAHSRTDLWLNVDFPEFLTYPSALAVVTADVGIVVERAEYWRAGGIPWRGGTATRATASPLVHGEEEDFVAETAAAARASFNQVALGAYTSPLALSGGEVVVSLEGGGQLLVHPGGGSIGFTTNYLAAAVSPANNLVIDFPFLTTAAGAWLVSGPQVTLTATHDDGSATTLAPALSGSVPTFVGLSGGRRIRSLRISSDGGWMLGVGDVVFAKP